MTITYSTGAESPTINTNDTQAVPRRSSDEYSYYNVIKGEWSPSSITGTWSDDQLVPWNALVFGKTYELQYNTTAGMAPIGSSVKWTTWSNVINISSRKNDYPSIRFRFYRNDFDIIEVYIKDGDEYITDYKLPTYTESDYYNNIEKRISQNSLYKKSSSGTYDQLFKNGVGNIVQVDIPKFKLGISCPYSSRPTGLSDLCTGYFYIEINNMVISDNMSVSNFTQGSTTFWTGNTTIYDDNINIKLLAEEAANSTKGLLLFSITVKDPDSTDIEPPILGYISSTPSYNNNNYSSSVVDVDKIEFIMQSYKKNSSSSSSSSSSSGGISGGSQQLTPDKLEDGSNSNQ